MRDAKIALARTALDLLVPNVPAPIDRPDGDPTVIEPGEMLWVLSGAISRPPPIDGGGTRMYVWSDGHNHRISMVGGIAFCQVFDTPGLVENHRSILLGEMAASARQILDRGLRPLGLILDLRRTPPIGNESGKMALGALISRWDKAGLPICLLVRDEKTCVSSYLEAMEAKRPRVLTSLPSAESWIRNYGIRPVPNR